MHTPCPIGGPQTVGLWNQGPSRKVVAALTGAWTIGDVDTLLSIQREVNIVVQTLFEAVPDNRIDGAYDKLFEKMYDAQTPLRMLPPYVGPSDDEYRTFVRLLGERLPEWVPAPQKF